MHICVLDQRFKVLAVAKVDNGICAAEIIAGALVLMVLYRLRRAAYRAAVFALYKILPLLYLQGGCSWGMLRLPSYLL